MSRFFFMLAFALTTAPSLAQSAPASVEMVLDDFSFAPATLHLAAGQPVTLHLVNHGGGHNFSAREFFAAATLAAGTSIENGRIELRRGETRDIALTPAAGRYRLRCTHALHAAFGMTGEIVVE